METTTSTDKSVVKQKGYLVTAENYRTKITVWDPKIEALFAILAPELANRKNIPVSQVLKELNKRWLSLTEFGQSNATKLQREIIGRN